MTRLAPPIDTHAEQEILGAILKDAKSNLDQVISALPNSELFYAPKHKTIYSVILDLAVEEEPIQIMTVSRRLSQIKKLDEIGGRLYLVELIEGVLTTYGLDRDAQSVREKGLLRQVILESQKAINAAYEQAASVVDTISRLEIGLARISSSIGLDDEPAKIADVLPEVLQSIQDSQRPEAKKKLIETGLNQVDRVTGGFGPGNLVAIGGWTSQGKTQLALQIAIHNAFAGNPVGMFSYEMNRQELVKRMLMTESKIGVDIIQAGQMTSDHWDTFRYQANRLQSAEILIHDRGNIDMTRLKALARIMVARRGIKLLIIDYIQLIDPGRGDFGNRQGEVAYLSRSSKNLAMELQIPVILLAQLTDLSASEKPRRPRLRDFRESKAISHDANKVLFVSQCQDYGAEIIIAKNREGTPGISSMLFDNGRWCELTRRSDR